MADSPDDLVQFEAVVASESGASMFDRASLKEDHLDRFRPPTGRGERAANALRRLGFGIRHIGTYSVSGTAEPALWRETFGTEVEKRSQPASASHPSSQKIEYWSHVEGAPFSLPEELDTLIDRIYPQRPPSFHAAPIPPRVLYHHLRVPGDVAMILRSSHVHQEGILGNDVLVAMVDTGFADHPFYDWHGFAYSSTLAPDATQVNRDEFGHGTAEAANVFSNAPNIDFIGVKVGKNPTLGFKTASDLHPAVLTNSWGFDVTDSSLPNDLKPLEAAVLEAVRDRGITVCFSAGNGQCAFPGQMPDVISVGGVYVSEEDDGSLRLQASNYASSYDSPIYPGRHVPDVCGLVGQQPAGVYIMLPVPPGSTLDENMASNKYPKGDGTGADDGWAVLSGTSAAAPQVAGICALLNDVQPGISPDLAKSILMASARDVSEGRSSETELTPDGQAAGPGHDGATGAGLVDADMAHQLARSHTPRSVDTIPPPR